MVFFRRPTGIVMQGPEVAALVILLRYAVPRGVDTLQVPSLLRLCLLPLRTQKPVQTERARGDVGIGCSCNACSCERYEEPTSTVGSFVESGMSRTEPVNSSDVSNLDQSVSHEDTLSGPETAPVRAWDPPPRSQLGLQHSRDEEQAPPSAARPDAPSRAILPLQERPTRSSPDAAS